MNSKKYVKWLVLCILSILVHASVAQNNRWMHTQFDAQAPVNRRISALSNNPSFYLLLPINKETRLSVGYDRSESNDVSLHAIYDGNQFSQYYIRAHGYNVDSIGVLVAGNASYTKSEKQNTRWNNMADWQNFYPYLVADTTGGNYFFESYRVSGTYGMLIGKKLHLSAQSQYHGGVAYRKIDPRPLNTVSDWKLSLGSLYSLQKWDIGAFLQYGFYKDNLSLHIEKANRKDYFYSLKGFGLFDYRLSTVDYSYSRYMSDNQWMTGFHMSQKNNKGFAAHVFATLREAKVEDSQKRTPYQIKSLGIASEVSYQWQIHPQHVLQLKGNAYFQHNKGTENQYDTIMLHREPDIIGYEKSYSAVKHRLTKSDFSISALYQWHPSSKSMFWSEIAGNYKRYSEEYFYPEYAMKTNHYLFFLQAGTQLNLRQSWLEMAACAAKKISANDTHLQLPPESKVVKQMVQPYFRYLKSDFSQLALHLKWYKPLSSKWMICIAGYGKYTFNGAHKNNMGAQLSFIF